MKKIIVLMTGLLLLTGCVKVSFTGPKKEEKTSQSTSSKKAFQPISATAVGTTRILRW